MFKKYVVSTTTGKNSKGIMRGIGFIPTEGEGTSDVNISEFGVEIRFHTTEQIDNLIRLLETVKAYNG